MEKEGKGILARRVGLAGLLAASIVMSLSTVVSVPAESPRLVLVPVSLLPDPTDSSASGFGKALTQGPTVNCSGSDPYCLGSVVVGAPDIGRVFAFMNPNNGSDSPLEGPAMDGLDLFGAALARLKDGIRDDLLIGAPGESEGRGAIYRASQGQPPLELVQYKPPTPLSRGAAFGSAIAAAGRMALVGAPGGAGAAYLIDFGGGSEEPTFQKLQSPNQTAGGRFGAAVAFSGNGLRGIVGAPFESAVYVFDTSTAGLMCTFADPMPAGQDHFGASLATMGELVIVGAPRTDVESQSGSQPIERAGKVHLFDLSACETTGIVQPFKTIPNPMPSIDAGFGTAVAVADLQILVEDMLGGAQDSATARILVGAPNDDTDAVDGGAVYQFDTSGEPLVQNRLPVSPDIKQPEARFGSAIGPLTVPGSDGITVAVSAPGPDGEDEAVARLAAVAVRTTPAGSAGRQQRGAVVVYHDGCEDDSDCPDDGGVCGKLFCDKCPGCSRFRPDRACCRRPGRCIPSKSKKLPPGCTTTTTTSATTTTTTTLPPGATTTTLPPGATTTTLPPLPCTTASDCPEDDAPCTRTTCSEGACGTVALRELEAVRCKYEAACSSLDVGALASAFQKAERFAQRAAQTTKEKKRRGLMCKALATTNAAATRARKQGKKGRITPACREGILAAVSQQQDQARTLFQGRCPRQ